MNENNKNHVELTNTEKSCGATNGIGEVKEEPPVLWPKRIKKLADWYIVEPFLILFFVSLYVGGMALKRLNQEKACRVYLNYNETICTNVINKLNDDNITIEIQTETVKAVADIIAWQYPMQKNIPAILILFVGAWSDRTGNRKVLMMIPVVGEIVSTCGLFLTTYYFGEWPLWLTALIESLPPALSGGISVAILGVFSYIADVTTAESRTFRLGMLAIIVIVCTVVGIASSGILLEAAGYYGVFAIQLVLHSSALSYVYFRIHNVRHEATEGTFTAKLKSFFNPYNIWNTISLVIVPPVQQRIRVILVLCAYVLVCSPVEGKGLLQYEYFTQRYGMTDVEMSMFNTYNTLMGVAGTTVAITLFSKYLKMHDSFLGIIGTTCIAVSSIVYGLAPTKQWVFAAPAFDIFGSSATTALKSLGTKVVDPDNVEYDVWPVQARLSVVIMDTFHPFLGTMLSLLGLTDALATAVFAPLFAKTYYNTVDTLPGAMFFLGSILTVPAICIFGAIFYIHKKQERDAVVNRTEKEMHAYDNDVTAL